VRIGSYEVVSEIGRGSMGVVYRARSPEGRDVALKLLSVTDADALASFEREARLLWSFNQADGFVPVIDAGAAGTRRFIVMPFLPGGTLCARLSRGALGVEDAVAIVSRIARAMGRAHERGVVHRDLKPENVLFDGDGAPLVADLGFAKHFRRDVLGASQSGSVTETGLIAGTPGYMAPEQIRDSKRAGPRADVFALGAILYEALTGTRPYQGTGLLGYTEALRGGAPTRPSRRRSGVPRELDAIVLRALEREEGARFADANELARALDGKGARRSRRVELIAGAVLLAVAIATAGLSLPRRPNDPRNLDLDGEAAQLVELASRKNHERDFAAGLAASTSAIAIKPGLARAWVQRSSARLQLGDRDGGLSDATKAIELEPGLAGAWMLRGVARLAKGDLTGAADDAQRAITLDPGFAMAWCLRGQVSSRDGSRASAIVDETKAIELDPRCGKAWLVRGNMYLDLGENEKAIEDETRAIEIDAAFAQAWLLRGWARQRLGLLEGAISDYGKAIEREPRRALHWERRGSARMRTPDSAGAVLDFDRAIEIDPKLAEAYAGRAYALVKQLRDPQAIEDCSRAIALDPSLALAWFVRGELRQDTSDLERGLALEPTGPDADHARDTLERLRGNVR
jgi:serine/threonine protein kinase/Tfp pilus assembly protein PilF